VDKYFTCAGSGLRYEDQERVSAESLRTLLLPSGGRSGISDRDRSKAWWGAQALFYGFKYTKTMTIAQVRAQLEDALRDKNKGLRVPQHILDTEYKHNKEFRELNAQVRDKAGMGGKRKYKDSDTVAPKTIKAKSVAPFNAGLDTSEGSPKKKPRVKQTDSNGLEVPRPKQTAKKPSVPTQKQQQKDWVDVGVKAQASEAPSRTKQTGRKTPSATPQEQPMHWLHMDVDVKLDLSKPRTKQTARKTTRPAAADDSNLDEPRAEMIAKRSVPLPVAPLVSSSSIAGHSGRPKQTARRGGAPAFMPPARSTGLRTDNVSGFWIISCPFITEEWGHNDLSINIVGRGSTLEGEFEFGIVRGLLRCDQVELRGPNGAYAAVYWAGKENDGPVLTPSREKSGYIKFTGDRLKGKLNSAPACGASGVDFEGQWVGGADPIVARWDDYNEDAYERANRARWGSRW
ncbi:hypothetical protein GGX14DRAFT_670423, partial [Mycena pura]